MQDSVALLYLDANATTPLRPQARQAMLAAMDRIGNPSSIHGCGQQARAMVEAARAQVAALAGVCAEQVVFTSGATEANAMALLGFPGRPRIVSAVEHPCVLAQAAREAHFDSPAYGPAYGPAYRPAHGPVQMPIHVVVAVDADGVIDLAALERALAATDRPALVSVMAANNETGVVQPVVQAAGLAHACGALFHCDAVQAAGRLPLAPLAAVADLLTLSAHKLGGPAGVGALILRPGLVPAPVLRGGGQELRRRAGTENVIGIAGFGAAAAACADGGDEPARLAAMRDRLERLVRAVTPGVRVFGAGVERVANTCCLALPGRDASLEVIAFDLAGIALSAGAACAGGRPEPSHVLAAMGVDAATAGAALRISFGWHNTEADVDRFLGVWTARAYRRQSAAPVSFRAEVWFSTGLFPAGPFPGGPFPAGSFPVNSFPAHSLSGHLSLRPDAGSDAGPES